MAWWDTRDDPGVRSNDVYYTYSNDNGKTWAKNVGSAAVWSWWIAVVGIPLVVAASVVVAAMLRR